MMLFLHRTLLALTAALGLSSSLMAYDNFKVAIYCRAQEVSKMGDTAWLETQWKTISSQVHVDRVYLESHRDGIIVPDATLQAAKAFFLARHVDVAGGITYTVFEPNRFETFSYSNPEHRARVKEIAEHTARNFDEFILDDFFFTSTKSSFDIAAKGDRSWTEYRLAIMVEAARDLVIGAAKAVNPKVKVVIKYPNWYDHFSGCGFDLADGPKRFDGIYAGTETRDSVVSAQHLQPYLGYNIIRYFENLAPGHNGGGWVDIYGSLTMDRYAEQLWLTLLAKAPEITLFDFRGVLTPFNPKLRGPWQGQGTSFSFDEMLKPVKQADGSLVTPTTFARGAAMSFEAVDKVLGALGKPIGLKSYKPFHSTGEAFLQNYLGTAGIPMDMVPEFPADEAIVLLTAQAAIDPMIVDKIEKQLVAGKKVVITSGLLKLLQDKGLSRIAEIRLSDRVASVKSFTTGRTLVEGQSSVTIHQLDYLTNDSWELVSGIDGDNGWPLLHDADYAKGHLYVLVIPDNYSDLYKLPAPVLNSIRATLTSHLPVQLEAPGKVSLLVYDNNTFVVESFLDEAVKVSVVLSEEHAQIKDVLTGEIIQGVPRSSWVFPGQPPKPKKQVMTFSIPAHSFRAFSQK
jgi:hypothetical protein